MRLLTGHARFVDDIELPGMLHAAFVRSSYAHARIRSIETAAARDLPGVRAVLALADLEAPYRHKRLAQLYLAPMLELSITEYPLADDEVNFVGQTVAIVLADSRYAAEDGAEAVDVDYEELPAVVECQRALPADAPLAHDGAPGNRLARVGMSFGDVEQAFGVRRARARRGVPPAPGQLSLDGDARSRCPPRPRR
ncbi:MAG: hypothetical protein OXG37_12420 [Actinomycetia bacterium]|nr:hypothetical protein [Actinomycetes bacterium]